VRAGSPLKGLVGNDPGKIAKTESLFRDVNERIAESASGVGLPDAVFVCECADPTCTDRLTVDLDDYERVREEATHFLVAPGHEVSSVERVVARRRGYQIVRKVERAVAAIVRRLNPRRDPA
jgi:hypothetical protein